MKAKALKYFRKHWDYKFTPTGGVICKNRNAEKYMEFDSIFHLVSWYASSDKFGIATYVSWWDKKVNIQKRFRFKSATPPHK